jgi:hypothetical protein
MTQPSTPRALRIPDILQAIFEQLADDRPALCAAARVDCLWAAHALDVLWHCPPQAAFRCVRPERRQFYAAKVRNVIVRKQSALLRPLAFPQLRAVAFNLSLLARRKRAASAAAGSSGSAHVDGGDGNGNGGGADNEYGGYGPFIGPRLERLSTKLDSDMLRLLLLRRPRLRELDIRDAEDDFEWNPFLFLVKVNDYDDDSANDEGGAGNTTGRRLPPKPQSLPWFNRNLRSPIDMETIDQQVTAYSKAYQEATPLPEDDQRRMLEIICGGNVIKTVKLCYLAPAVFDDVLLRVLAPHETLLALRLRSYLPSTSLLADIAAQVPRPFAGLQSLDIEITPATLPALLRLVPSITSLELEVDAGDYDSVDDDNDESNLFDDDSMNDDGDDGDSEVSGVTYEGAGGHGDEDEQAHNDDAEMADDTMHYYADFYNAGGMDGQESPMYHVYPDTDLDMGDLGTLLARVTDGGQVFSRVVAQLPGLRSLRVSFQQGTRLPVAELLAVCRLAQLEELAVRYRGEAEAVVRVD